MGETATYLFVRFITPILNWIDFYKTQNMSKTPATCLLHLLVSHCHFPHLFSPFFFIGISLNDIRAIYRKGHITSLYTEHYVCSLRVYIWNTHLPNAQDYHEICVSRIASFSCLSAGKSFQSQAAHLEFLLLSWDADVHFEYMVISSFQLSLFANIWTPVIIIAAIKDGINCVAWIWFCVD